MAMEDKKAKVVSDAIKDLESGNLDTHVAVSHERFENITKRFVWIEWKKKQIYNLQK